MTSPFEELKESREHLISEFSNGTGVENFEKNYTEMMDQYFRRMFQESESAHRLFRGKRPFAFMAVGGYGRRELCLHSDIDIIILFGSKIPARAKQLSDEIFFPLWDLGLDLGYGIRTIKDCLTLSRNDFEVLTSMMDARFICGDSPLFLSLTENLHKKVISKKTTAFGQWLEDLDKIRMDNFGDASYLLEPHLKEGIGGLRDYHHMLWLAKAFFHSGIPRDLEFMGKLSHNEYRELEDNLAFIRLVRNHLHHLSGRRNDRLNFEYQEKIARILGFQDRKDVMAVENFLGKLHACMSSVKDIHRSFVTSHIPKKFKHKKGFQARTISKGLHVDQNEINFDSATAILSTPLLLMEIFEQSALLDRPLSMEARRLVREFLHLVDDAFRSSHEAVRRFFKIIGGENIDSLNQMFETGFLDAFIPEFGRIRDRVQFDAYHTFPVGRHSLEAVRQLKDLPNEKEIILLDVFSDLPDPEPLFLAALFHDIGKTGKDHSRKGVDIARNILKRFGYEKDRAEKILFLIRHHLLLAETATRRDLNDEKVIVRCARTIRDVERLNMLYLLTWADSRATGPKAWNEWTANLVQELFFKILHILKRGELATPGASMKVGKTKARVRRETEDRISAEDLDKLFDVMSPRYLLNTSPGDIVCHLEMLTSFKEQLNIHHQASAFSVKAREYESEGCWELTFLAKDRPGLFSDLAGVLALNNINILSAQIYTWRDGIAVDIFKVTHPLDAINPDETWKRVKRDLENTFTGKLSLEYRLSQKAAPSILSDSGKPEHPPKVIVDNETSDFFTLIEVFADDRVGLLYLITRCLFDLRLDIRISKIATKADQVADVFYVRDLDGQKIEDKSQLLEIERALLHRLTQ